MVSMSMRTAGWPAMRWLLVGVPLLALIGQMWPILHRMWMTNSTYSHGYLVLGLAAWLAVREFRRAPVGGARPSWIGLALLGTLAAGVFLARAIDVQLVQEVAIPALLVAAVWAAGGFALAGRFAVPAGYLYFAVSVWDYLTEPLRAMTTVAVGAAARLTSIPVYIVGNSIHIPAGTFEVEGGCSGLHYVIVSGALAAYCGLVQYRGLVPRLALLAVALAVGVLANWVRVYLIVVAGHVTDMQHFLVTVDHYYFGWVLFLVMIVPLLYASGRFASPESGSAASTDGGAGTNGDVGAGAARAGNARAGDARSSSPESAGSATSAVSSSRIASALTVRSLVAPLAALLLAGVVLVNVVSGGTAPATALSRTGDAARLPQAVGEWRSSGEWTGPSRPEFVGADRELSGRYQSGAAAVHVHAVGYDWQRQGAELIYYSNLPIPDQDIVRLSAGTRVGLAAGGDMDLMSYRVEDRQGRQRVVWVGYRVAGVTTGRDLVAKLYQAFGALRGRRDGQALVMSSPCTPDCAAAEEALKAFARAAAPLLFQAVQPADRAAQDGRRGGVERENT